jgi:hypothetical protein
MLIRAWLPASMLLLAAIQPVLAAPVAQGIGIGSGRLYPSLGAELRHESNFFRTPERSKVPDLSTWVSVLRPQLTYTLFKGQRAARAYRITYAADIGTVENSPNDNYVDQHVNASANWETTLANRYRLEYEFLRAHDRRGSGDPADVTRANFSSHPDLWKSQRVEGGWSVGRPGRKTLIDLWITHYARRYINNDQQTRNNDRLTLNATLSRRLAPKTRSIVQLWGQQIDYVNEPPGTISRDSEELRLYTGVLWEISPKTSINGRGGWLIKDFRSPQRQDVFDFGWEIDLRWRPRLERMVLDLSTKRVPRESTVPNADAVVISSYQLNWLHYLKPNKRRYYELGAYYTNDNYVGEKRVDNRLHLNAGFYTQFRRRTVFGLSYEHQQRDSDEPLARYNNDVLSFTVDVDL